MTDWRAVGVGFVAGVGYLGVLLLPPLSALRWGVVPLVLAAGLVAGTAASLAAGADPHAGGRLGLLGAGATGLAFALAFRYALARPGAPPGAFYALNYLLATNAGRFPAVARHGPVVVSGLAVAGGAGIALLGLYAGTRAPTRAGRGLLEVD